MPFIDPASYQTPETVLESNVKMVKGTDTTFLPVPGLITLNGLKINGYNVDLKMRYTVPVDVQQTQFETIEEPLAVISEMDGQKVLLRNLNSNFGIWQADAEFTVIGDWDTVAAASVEVEAVADPEPEKKDEKKAEKKDK